MKTSIERTLLMKEETCIERQKKGDLGGFKRGVFVDR